MTTEGRLLQIIIAYVPEILIVTGFITSVLFARWLGAFQTRLACKRDLERDLPEITREKLKERDRRIKRLELELEQETQFRKDLQRAIRIADHAFRDYVPRRAPAESEEEPELTIARRSR